MATHRDQSAPTPFSTRTVFAWATIRAAERARRMQMRRRPEAGGGRGRGRVSTGVRLGIALASIAAGIGWLLFG